MHTISFVSSLQLLLIVSIIFTVVPFLLVFASVKENVKGQPSLFNEKVIRALLFTSLTFSVIATYTSLIIPDEEAKHIMQIIDDNDIVAVETDIPYSDNTVDIEKIMYIDDDGSIQELYPTYADGIIENSDIESYQLSYSSDKHLFIIKTPTSGVKVRLYD